MLPSKTLTKIEYHSERLWRPVYRKIRVECWEFLPSRLCGFCLSLSFYEPCLNDCLIFSTTLNSVWIFWMVVFHCTSEWNLNCLYTFSSKGQNMKQADESWASAFLILLLSHALNWASVIQAYRSEIMQNSGCASHWRESQLSFLLA